MIRNIIPYAFIRVFNDQLTVRSCLESILPTIDRGIIATHVPPPGVRTDKTLEILQEFVAKNPGFRLVIYPYPVIPANHEIYFNEQKMQDLDPAWNIAEFYQFTLNELVKLAKENGEYDEAWLFKVDADHIYCNDALLYMLNWAKADPRTVENYFSIKFNVVYIPSDNQVYSTGLVNPCDHYFSKLEQFPGFELAIIPKSKSAWEQLINPPNKSKQLISLEYEHYGFLNSFHFNVQDRLYHNFKLNLEVTPLTILDDPQEQNREKIANIGIEIVKFKDFFCNDKALELALNFDTRDLPQSKEYFTLNSLDENELFTNPIYRSDADFVPQTKIVYADKDVIEKNMSFE